MRKTIQSKLKAMMDIPWLANAAAICTGILFWYLLKNLPFFAGGISYILKTVSSVMIGIIIAYLLNPVCVFIENKILGKMKNRGAAHTVSVILALLLMALVLALFLVILIPSLLESVNLLISNINSYVSSSDQLIEKLEAWAADYGINLSTVADQMSDMVDNLIKELPNIVNNFITGSFRFGSSMAGWAIGLIFAVYFLTGKKTVLEAVNKFRHAVLREETVRKHDIFFKHCDHIMTNYVGYTLLDALIVGIANALFMLVCGIPYVGLVSMIVAVTNLLPTFGPVIGAIVGGLLLLLHNPVQALYFLGFTIVLQTLDGYVIKPRLFSGSLGVPSILVLVSVVVGGELFGVTGIILAIPFAAIIAYVYNDILFPSLLRRKERIEAPENE